VSSTGLAALPELRAQRRKNRIARLDWFEAAYRAYLTAFVGGLVIIWIAGAIGGTKVTASELVSLRQHAPALLGVLAALSMSVGLRSGSRGGPLALEPAEVRHILLAPIRRRRVLMSGAIKVVRHTAFGGLAAGAAFGVMASRRLPGSRWSWAASGALFAGVAGLAMVACAFVASGLRLKRSIATALAAVVLAGAIADLLGKFAWPTTAIGSLALWPLRVHVIDLLAIPLIAVATVAGLSLLDRLSLENAEKRTALVGQMRFAVTMQDLRTVTVLRRQLTAEAPRRRPWFGRRKRKPHRKFPIWARCWQGLLRTPAGRLVRMVGLSAIVGVILPGIIKGNGALVFLSGVGSYLIGLDIIEPLAQAVDNTDRTDLAPMDRGLFFLRHLPASAVASAVLSLITIGVATLLTHSTIDREMMAIGSPLVLLSGLAGAIISVMMGAPDQSGNSQLLPPEVAGMKIAGRAAWPFLVATAGGLPLIFAQRAIARNADALASFGRTAVWIGFLIAFVGAWVRHRDAARAWWAKTMKDSQEQAAARKKPQS
jgi:hypothetical protein